MERLRGALEVTVSALVDRAFATQTAYVHCVHSLSKQAQAMSSLNSHLMTVRQVRAACRATACAHLPCAPFAHAAEASWGTPEHAVALRRLLPALLQLCQIPVQHRRTSEWLQSPARAHSVDASIVNSRKRCVLGQCEGHTD